MANDLKFSLKLDINPYSTALKTAINLSNIASKEIKSILSGVKADVDTTLFDKEIAEMEAKLKHLEGHPIEIPVEVDDDGVEKFDNKLKNNKKSLGSYMGTLKDLGFSLFGLQTIYNTITNVVSKFTEKTQIQEKAEAKVEQAVKQTGMAAGYTATQLENMASEMQELTTFGDELILSSVTNQLLTFTNIVGEEFQRAQMIALDFSTVLDGDVSASALQVGKALNDIPTGLSALSRSGVQFTQEQKDLANALWETGQRAEAQRMVLDELERQYGGQAKAIANTYSGALEQFNNAWGDLNETLGMLVLPVLAKMATSLKVVIEAVQDYLKVFRSQDQITKELLQTKKDYVQQLINEKQSELDIVLARQRASDSASDYDEKVQELTGSLEELQEKQQDVALYETWKNSLSASKELEESLQKVVDSTGNIGLKPHVFMALKDGALSTQELDKITEEYNSRIERLILNEDEWSKVFSEKDRLKKIEDYGDFVTSLEAYQKQVEAVAQAEIDLKKAQKGEPEEAPEVQDQEGLSLSFELEEEKAQVDEIEQYIKDSNERIYENAIESAQKRLENEAYYYEQVKFEDESYFDYTLQQEYARIEAMQLSADQEVLLKQQTLDKLSKDQDIYNKKEVKNEEKKRKNEITAAKAYFGGISQLMSNYQGESRALFEIGKAASIAKATINTYEAITTTMKAYAFPFNLVPAAAAAANGFAQVSKIQATGFDQGGLATIDDLIKRSDLAGTGLSIPDGEDGLVAVRVNERMITPDRDSENDYILDAINAKMSHDQILSLIAPQIKAKSLSEYSNSTPITDFVDSNRNVVNNVSNVSNISSNNNSDIVNALFQILSVTQSILEKPVFSLNDDTIDYITEQQSIEEGSNV